jgi:hypothetical protein
MQEDDLKVDVGEADEQEQEIDLDAAPQQEEPEEQVDVQEEAEAESEPEAKAEKREELDDYSEGVQKRIAKLTRKMREAERQKEEAIQYAQSVQTENQSLKSKYDYLNTNYSGEFEKRVKSDLEAAQIKLKDAIANNDIDEQVKAQTILAGLSMDSTRLDAMRKAREEMEKLPAQEQDRQPVMQQTPAATPAPDPKADAWAAKNSWFGTDNAMTYSAFDIHKKLVEEEGFDPTSDEYYSEVDKRIRLEFPHKFGNNESTTAEQPAQTVASAKRPATKGRRKTVKLTPSQVAISKRLGVPLEEYAKQLAAKEV